MFDIEEELKKLPAKPGVYLMHDANDSIIYVGKAISLKKRVRQYFQSSRNLMPKIQKMVSMIDHFEYIVVDSEMEALVLECNLIKEYRPKYNTMLKDDKKYPYIKVTVTEPFPRVLLTRERKNDKAKYFGPYTNQGAVKDILDLLQKTYGLRTCSKKLPKETGTERPCLYYQMGQCKAPCQGFVSQTEYGEAIRQVIAFLNGNDIELRKQLETKMKEAVAVLEFEKAAEYRDLLYSVEKLAETQKAESDIGIQRDIIAFATAGDEAVVQVFFVRDGKMIGREHFYLTGVAQESRQSIMTEFVKQFYAGTPYIPKELVLSETVADMELIMAWLSHKSGKKVSICVPKKGEKERLVKLAETNASIVLQKDTEKIAREEAKTIGALQELSDYLQLSNIKRIESYDISNTSGFASVASMVVFEDGKPKKTDYRKFRIQTVQGPNDYASMKEVLQRRFLHGLEQQEQKQEHELDSFTKYPDVLFIDGGKGQVNAVLEVLNELALQIPVCGMIKDEHHHTRGLYYENKEIAIDTASEAFKFITRVQDETHRFAIEYHRSLRSKAQVHSILDDIPQIGKARRLSLMKHFSSLEEIKNASVEELAQLPKMNQTAAEAVYTFFHCTN